MAKLELWNGNSNGIHENASGERKNDLQNKLTQVTDELNQLKSQISSSPEITTVERGSFHSTTLNQSSNNSFDITNIDEHVVSSTITSTPTTSIKKVNSPSENGDDDKDRQISFLTNKLNESDKEANELRREVERLRDIIKQQHG